VRPAFVLACARAAGGGAEPNRWAQAAVDAAVAVELVHDFSLLHDDVMDGDLTRRHRAAAWAVFGVGRAILVGDALLALAMDVLTGDPERDDGLDAGAPHVLSGTLLELCRGQSADLAFENRGDVTLTECLASSQREHGRWGTWAGTREETAYAIEILAYTGGVAVPDQTIEFLSAADGTAHPPLWIAKDPYCPTAIVEAAILAALRLAGQSAKPQTDAA
jgi:Polyprenyl synthetase